MEQLLNQLLENSSFPLLTAIALGLMTAFSPCPLATNITAIGYISKDISDQRRVFINGLWYTAGRATSYFILAVVLRYSAFALNISSWLQVYGEKILGPLLIVFGLLMLDLVSFRLPGLAKFGQRINDYTLKRKQGPFLLGVLFALAFCPYSGVLYFGMLIPLSIQYQAGVFLALAFAVATGLPVILLAWLLAYTVSGVSKWYRRIKVVELWFRRIVAVVFIGAGVWFIINTWIVS